MNKYYHDVCDPDAGTFFITDKYFENMAHNKFRVKKLTRNILINQPHIDTLVLMAKVNAIIDGRPEGEDT